MKLIPLYTLAALFTCGGPVAAQTASPPSSNTPAAAEPAAGSGMALKETEKYVAELTELIAARETAVTRLVNDISAHDKSINAAVEKVLQILANAKDTPETRSKVAQMKIDMIAALKKAAQAYTQKRSLIAEELAATKNEFRKEDLFTSRGQLDTRIDTMVDAMLQLALSMETDESHERYIKDSEVMVGGRYGISVPTTKRNPDYDQNKRQAAKAEQVSGELGKSLAASLQRLEIQEREISSKLSKPETSADEKLLLETELGRITAIKAERLQQQSLLSNSAPAGGQTPLDRKEFSRTEEIIRNIVGAARRDFSRMMASFNELRSERQAMADLKLKLDEANKTLDALK